MVGAGLFVNAIFSCKKYGIRGLLLKPFFTNIASLRDPKILLVPKDFKYDAKNIENERNELTREKRKRLMSKSYTFPTYNPSPVITQDPLQENGLCLYWKNKDDLKTFTNTIKDIRLTKCIMMDPDTLLKDNDQEQFIKAIIVNPIRDFAKNEKINTCQLFTYYTQSGLEKLIENLSNNKENESNVLPRSINHNQKGILLKDYIKILIQDIANQKKQQII